jgi:hypothetical protein
MMLLIHLSTLTIISFVPGERVGVSVKKVCLRQETGKQLVTSADKPSYIQQLLNKVPDAQSGQKDGTVEIHCSVKLICTAATDAFVFTPPYLDYQKPDFTQPGYCSFIKFLEPDPPRLS